MRTLAKVLYGQIAFDGEFLGGHNLAVDLVRDLVLLLVLCSTMLIAVAGI